MAVEFDALSTFQSLPLFDPSLILKAKTASKLHIRVIIIQSWKRFDSYTHNRVCDIYCREHGFGQQQGFWPKIPRTFQSLTCSGQRDLTLLARKTREDILMLTYHLGSDLGRALGKSFLCKRSSCQSSIYIVTILSSTPPIWNLLSSSSLVLFLISGMVSNSVPFRDQRANRWSIMHYNTKYKSQALMLLLDMRWNIMRFNELLATLLLQDTGSSNTTSIAFVSNLMYSINCLYAQVNKLIKNSTYAYIDQWPKLCMQLSSYWVPLKHLAICIRSSSFCQAIAFQATDNRIAKQVLFPLFCHLSRT